MALIVGYVNNKIYSSTQVIDSNRVSGQHLSL